MMVRLEIKALVLCFVFGVLFGQDDRLPVELRSNDAEKKVEVWVGGRHFTTYQYGPKFDQKPVFYPVLAPHGAMVNRELPFGNAELKEKQDHPHHQSLFFGYGDVDGSDFWSSKQGERIVHKAILKGNQGSEPRLDVFLEWTKKDGEVPVEELRRVTFGGTSDSQWIDHDITLLSTGGVRLFHDTKEGLFAIRLADSLKEAGGTGHYINSYGWEEEANVWGKRAPWVALSGVVEGKEVTVAIFDHPSTDNYPSYWHARKYGLFAVNPFGRKDFVKGASPLEKTLSDGGKMHFRYRLVVYNGKVGAERINREYSEFIQ